MKMIRNFLLFLAALAFSLAARAEDPEYAGSAFDSITQTTNDASLFFGVVVALAVLVTGFFLGRKWLKSV